MSASPVVVLVTVNLPDHLIEQIRQVSPRLQVQVHAARRWEDIPADAWRRAEVLYTQDTLPDPDKAPNLKWVQFNSAGIDGLLKAPVFQRSEIQFTTLSGAAAPHLAEFCLAMMLALGHRLPDLFRLQNRAEWPSENWQRLVPKELRGSTVGIVGYGSIGRELARLLQSFQVTILATKRDVMHPADSGYVQPGLGDPEGNLFHRLYPAQAVKSMLKECDFVVVTVPLTSDTRGLLREDELRAMKPSAFLIDVGRGEVVDHRALLAALQENRLAGAALDVFPEEPLPASSPLWKANNVIITPHIAGMSAHYKDRAIGLFTENLKRYLNGAPLYNRYDMDRGY